MKGLQFWNTNKTQAVAFDPIVGSRLETVRAWCADTRDEPVYELLIDEQTDVFINGWPQSLDALRPGDNVGVCCVAESNATHALRPIQLRVYRFRN